MRKLLQLSSLLGALLLNNRVNAQSFQGPFPGGTFVNDASIGSVGWNNLGNAVYSDNNYIDSDNIGGTNCNTDYTRITKYLKGTNFGFNIPVGASIDGILVEVEKSYLWDAACIGGGAASFCRDNSVKIVKSGLVTGTEQKNSSNWSYTDTSISYGGSTDLWGTTWTPSEINSSDFGVAVSLIAEYYAGSDNYGYVDQVHITVYYTGGITDIQSPGSIAATILHPNPADNAIAVDYSVNRPGQTSVEILDILGRVVKHFTTSSYPGSNHMDIGLSDLEEGTYSIILTSDNERYIKRFAKNN